MPSSAKDTSIEGLTLRKPLLFEFFREETMKNYSIHLIYLTVPGRVATCGIVGSSSLIRDQTWVPSAGSIESQSLGHQGSPSLSILSE